MKRILVPTDFSSCADKALTYAVEIAKKAHAEIILMHACDLLRSDYQDRRSMIEEHNQGILEDVNGKLRAIKQRMREEVPLQLKVYDGNLIDSIQEATVKNQIDLIIMGTQGASGIKEIILGSKTATTISKVSVPVLTIPEGYSGFSLKKILIAINHAEDNLNNLAPAFEIARLFDAPVRLAIFSGEGDDAATFISDRRTIINIQAKLKDLYEVSGLEVEHLSGINFQKTLQEFINKNTIDLLVMITHRRGSIESLFNRSMTKKMAYHTAIPLLSLHQ